MPQTSVLSTMPFGVPGQPADLHTAENGDVVSATNGEAAAEIPFGVFVMRNGTTPNSAKLFVEDGLLYGISVQTHALDKPTQLGDTGVKAGVEFGVARSGRWLVMPETDVTPASEVHIRHTVSGNTVLGGVRGTADAGKSIDASGFCKWHTAGGPTSGNPAELEIWMPGTDLAVEDS